MTDRKSFRLHYGGWGNYREWAEHGFVPRPQSDDDQEEAGQDRGGGENRPERPTEDVPSAVETTVDLADLDNVAYQSCDHLRIRPYALTRGRTHPRRELPIHALVSTDTSGLGDAEPALPHEHRAIVELCAHVRSVAEVAVGIGVPIGVARVLIDDLARGGALVIHQNESILRDRPSLDLMRRVLEGLNRL